MDNPKDDSLDSIECDVLAEHAGARVVIRRTIRKEYDKLNIQAQGRFSAVMKRWCEDPAQLTQEMFNGNESRTPRHGEMLNAFKNNSAKLRLYGFSSPVEGRRTFIIVDIAAKKQKKADPNVLKRAKTRIDDFIDKYGKKDN